VLEREHQYGPASPPVREGNEAIIAGARAAIARHIGATPDSIVLTQGAAHALNLVFSGLQFTMGDEIVTTDAEHHALAVPALYARRRFGLGMKVVSITHSMSEEEILLEFERLIGRTTRLVAISEVSFNTGVRLPVRRIADMAHSYDAVVLVDGAQAAGQTAVDVRRLGADLYALSGHKWLLGPAGAGALYIRPGLVDKIEAMMVSGNATRSFDGRGTFEPRRDSVEKFDLTETSAPLWAGLTAALGFIDAMSTTSVEGKVKEFGALLTSRLAAIDGVRVMAPPPGPLSSGIVPFLVEGVPPDDLTMALWEGNNTVARTVPGRPATRLCVHGFNTTEEINRVIAFVAEVVDRVRNPVRWNWSKRE
jgi:L-cysteine/cystine lyase